MKGKKQSEVVAEKHWRISDVLKVIPISHQTAVRMFENLPGVKTLGQRFNTKRQRRYRTLLIPDSVLREELARLE